MQNFENYNSLSHYEDVEVISSSSKGIIYLVRHKQTSQLAIKRYMPYNSVYFTLQKLSDEHLPEILYVERAKDELVVIEEYIYGEKLSDILARKGKLDEKTTKQYITQLCEALRCLHNQKPPIIHRDIKPENIIISNDGILKLIDFDVSRTYDANKNVDTQIIGTPGYAAPEQYGFTQSDPRIDIYAIGVLMHQLLTGDMPNKTKYRGAYKTVIEKCMSMDRDKRYRDCFSLMVGLEPPMRAIRRIPGFRTGTWWKVLLAIIGYPFGYYIFRNMLEIQRETNGDSYFIAASIITLSFAIIYILITDIFNLRKKLLQFRVVRRILFIIFCIWTYLQLGYRFVKIFNHLFFQ